MTFTRFTLHHPGALIWPLLILAAPAAWGQTPAPEAPAAPQAVTAKAASSLSARRRAVTLMNAGKFPEAYEVLKLALVDFPQDHDVRFLMGQCALELNKPDESAAQFEAMLAANPNLPRVRLELARAYTSAKRFDQAREQFNQVMATNPPPAVGDNIQKFLEMIDAQRPWRARVSFSVVSDSNVTTGPSGSSVLAPGFTNPTGHSDLGLNLTASLSHIYAINQQFAWQSEASLNVLDYQDEDPSDLESVSLSTGPTWSQGPVTVSLPMVYDSTKVGHDPYNHSVGLAPQLQYAISPELQLTSSLSMSRRKHDKPVASATERDGQVHSISGGARIRVSDAIQLQPTLRIAREQTTVDYFDNESAGVSLGVLATLPNGYTLYAQPSVTRTLYRAPDPFLILSLPGCFDCTNTRRDWQYQFTLNLSKAIGKTGLSAALGYTYTRNDSNIGQNDYERHQGTAMLTYAY